MIFLGLPFCWSNRGFRYLLTVLVMLWFLHTNFLAALSPRYCYYYQPLVILAGTAAAMMLYDRVVSLAHRAGNSLVARASAHATGLAVLTLLFLQSNESVMKGYTLSSKGDLPTLMTRMNTYKYDYRGVAEYVKNHFRPGDRIVPGIAHVFEVLHGKTRRLCVGYSFRIEGRLQSVTRRAETRRQVWWRARGAESDRAARGRFFGAAHLGCFRALC